MVWCGITKRNHGDYTTLHHRQNRPLVYITNLDPRNFFLAFWTQKNPGNEDGILENNTKLVLFLCIQENTKELFE